MWVTMASDHKVCPRDVQFLSSFLSPLSQQAGPNPGREALKSEMAASELAED